MARKNGTGNGSQKSALADLVARAERNASGAASCRSDPLADAKAARGVVDAARAHAAELSRRGMPDGYCEAALELAEKIEQHLQALPAAALAARGHSEELTELLADAAATAQAVRGAVLRVTRDADGRHKAHDFGLGQPFSARQPAHVLRALQQILQALEAHKELRADLGVQAEDVRTIQELARDLERLSGKSGTISDEQADLLQAQGALRAFFDLFAAKMSLALAGDPDERARVLSLIPRADERRHLRQKPERASG